MRRYKKKNQIVKPNIIPILDAVFIFIFFLLMSAQFLEIYELGSDAPAVKTVDTQDKDKKLPLNLVLAIGAKSINVKTGLDEITVGTVNMKDGDYDYTKLKEIIVNIKKKNIDESSVVLRPTKKVAYKKIVYIMDTVRALDIKEPNIVGKNSKGKTIQTKTLFDQIIFETLI
tara:strand:- start:126121 stop:126636 length:516 start_codon:yes stop_codon:yes gene_type:complete